MKFALFALIYNMSSTDFTTISSNWPIISIWMSVDSYWQEKKPNQYPQVDASEPPIAILSCWLLGSPSWMYSTHSLYDSPPISSSSSSSYVRWSSRSSSAMHACKEGSRNCPFSYRICMNTYTDVVHVHNNRPDQTYGCGTVSGSGQEATAPRGLQVNWFTELAYAQTEICIINMRQTDFTNRYRRGKIDFWYL